MLGLGAQVKDAFAAKDGRVDFDEFSQFYQNMRFREEITLLFRVMVPSKWSNLPLDDMRKFCTEQQGMVFASDEQVRGPRAGSAAPHRTVLTRALVRTMYVCRGVATGRGCGGCTGG
jgi:hypothetical protein